MSSIIFDGGSTNSTITGVSCGSSIAVNSPNITITRCKIGGGVGFGQSSGTIGGTYQYGSNCNLTSNFIEGGGINGNPNATNCTITNNIMSSQGQIYLSGLVSANISYNTFNVGQFNTGFSGIQNCIFANNIIDGRSTAITTVIIQNSNNTTVSNNICLGINGLPTGAGNINGANPSIIFTGSSNPFTTYTGANNSDKDFQLAVGSPALTAAAGGTQAGAFGNGANAYRLSGVPNTPIVTSFISTGSGNNTTPLSITVSVRSNN